MNNLQKEFMEYTGKKHFKRYTPNGHYPEYYNGYTEWLEDRLQTITQQSLSGSDPKGSTPKVCPKCYGKGKHLDNTEFSRFKKCRKCNGTGQTF